MTEITAVRPGLGRRLAHALSARSGPPSLRAQIVLLLAALLLGGVLSGLAFVGVWRHTAAEGDVARAEQREAAQKLRLAQAKTNALERDLAAARAHAAKTAATLRAASASLAAVRRRDARAAAALGAPLGNLVSGTDELARRTAKLRSALASVAAYLHGPGVDPAFAEAQVRYVIASTDAVERSAASVARAAAEADAAAGVLRRH